MKRKVYLTQEQFKTINPPKKVRQGLVPYGDGECGCECGGMVGEECDYEISKSNGDLGYAHIVNRKTLNEALDPNFDLTPYFNSFNDFLLEMGINIKPFPAINLDVTDQGKIMIKTGFYNPSDKSITLFVKDRHPKDILRSYAHEMVHHIQNLENPDRDWGSGKDLKDDDVLSQIEEEAYSKGNMLFRAWTEHLSKHPDKRLLQESKKKVIKNDKGEIVPDKCDKCGEDVVLQIHGEPVYVCKKCGKYFGTMPCRLNEATEKDVDLSSFKVRDSLTPDIWENDKLKKDVRKKLEEIADDFIDFLEVSWVEPSDAIIVGSITNYNWSRFSDIDLHIVIDFSKVDKNVKFVKEYFNSKKKEWNDTHDGIKIYGFPVELYVQDKDEKVASGGIYSLWKNEWIKKANKGTFTKQELDALRIKRKAVSYMTDIENLENKFDGLKNGDKGNETIFDKSTELLGKIKNGRRENLKTAKDEMDADNIVFKVLRRNGYLEKLFSLKNKSYDKKQSIE